MPKSFQRGLAVFLTVMLTITPTLTGCRSVLKPEAAQSQLVLTTLQDPKTFNYALNQEFPSVFLFTYQGLTTENGTTGEIEPALAESWKISQDGPRDVDTLRDGRQRTDRRHRSAIATPWRDNLNST